MKDRQDVIVKFVREEDPSMEPYLDFLLIPPSGDEITHKYPDAEGCEMLQKHDVILFSGISRYSYYYVLRKQGQSHNFAEMVVMQRAARGTTDDSWFAGVPMLADQFRRKEDLDRVLDAAKAQGFTPSPHALYMPNLARFKGDRRAFVTRTDGREYVRKELERQGFAVDQSMDTMTSERGDPGEGVALADDLIEQYAQVAVNEDPKLAKLNRQELREKIIDKHALKPEE